MNIGQCKIKIEKVWKVLTNKIFEPQQIQEACSKILSRLFDKLLYGRLSFLFVFCLVVWNLISA